MMHCHSGMAPPQAARSIEQFFAQYQGEKGAEDVATDRSIGAMKDRPGGEHGLGREEGSFDRQQVAVAQHDGQG